MMIKITKKMIKNTKTESKEGENINIDDNTNQDN